MPGGCILRTRACSGHAAMRPCAGVFTGTPQTALLRALGRDRAPHGFAACSFPAAMALGSYLVARSAPVQPPLSSLQRLAGWHVKHGCSLSRFVQGLRGTCPSGPQI